MAFCGIFKRYVTARKNENDKEMAKIIEFVAMRMAQVLEIHHGISRTVTSEIQQDLNKFVHEQLEKDVYRIEAHTNANGLNGKDEDLTKFKTEERRKNNPQTITELFNEMEEIPLYEGEEDFNHGRDSVDKTVSGPKVMLDKLYQRLRSSLKICRSGQPSIDKLAIDSSSTSTGTYSIDANSNSIDHISITMSTPSAEKVSFKKSALSVRRACSAAKRLFTCSKKCQVSIEETCTAATSVRFLNTSTIQMSSSMKKNYIVSNSFPLLQRLRKINCAKYIVDCIQGPSTVF